MPHHPSCRYWAQKSSGRSGSHRPAAASTTTSPSASMMAERRQPEPEWTPSVRRSDAAVAPPAASAPSPAVRAVRNPRRPSLASPKASSDPRRAARSTSAEPTAVQPHKVLVGASVGVHASRRCTHDPRPSGPVRSIDGRRRYRLPVHEAVSNSGRARRSRHHFPSSSGIWTHPPPMESGLAARLFHDTSTLPSTSRNMPVGAAVRGRRLCIGASSRRW